MGTKSSGPTDSPSRYPSDQRLDGPHGSGAQVDDRLVVDDQVLTVSALAKGRLGALAFDRLAPQGVIEDDPTTAAVGLRLVHRGVGIAEHRSRIGLGGIGVGDADRDAGMDLVAIDQERGLEGRLHPVGDDRGVLVRLEPLAQHHELVTAESGDGVAGPHRGANAFADRPEQSVTEGVTEAVVDDLEVIEVDEQHADRLAGPRGPQSVDRLGDALEQERPVRQAGEWVVGGLAFERCLELFALADVVQDGGVELDLVVVVAMAEHLHRHRTG